MDDLNDKYGTPEKCSICLTELYSIYNNEDPDVGVVRTKCNHIFHEPCLKEVKVRKPHQPDCPLCRSLLTPLNSQSSMIEDNSINPNIPGHLRSAIVRASVRGRNAVRAALERRQPNISGSIITNDMTLLTS